MILILIKHCNTHLWHAAAMSGILHLVYHIPDGGARLVQRGDDGVAQRGQARHVVHDV